MGQPVRSSGSWIPLTPPLAADGAGVEVYFKLARKLARRKWGRSSQQQPGSLREVFLGEVQACPKKELSVLRAAGLILIDLHNQGWRVRVSKGVVLAQPPSGLDDNVLAEKERVRAQELIKRNAQLQRPSVQRFVRSMERRRLHQGAFVSVFSLMRDGRELAASLRKLRKVCEVDALATLESIIQPYIQFVERDATCEFVGLRLMDIWRYFRHTWTNHYTTVPGRTMLFLVRDGAAPCHPIIGIGALSSPIVQIRERDTWIGWHPTTFVEQVRERPTVGVARWLKRIVDEAIKELYVQDFLADQLVTTDVIRRPDVETIKLLLDEGTRQRELHHRYTNAQEHKSKGKSSHSRREDHWAIRAETHLFRSKRARILAEFLRARMLLSSHFNPRPSSKGLASLLETSEGVRVVRKIVRKAKADRVGIAMADISVCGAVQPYNAILGGKLISMLAMSPEVVAEYRQRYSRAESEIASSMAGRAISRPSNLVFLGTTSLYGVGASQYNRVKVPCDLLGGRAGDSLAYKRLGRSESFGTSQYSDETVRALQDLVRKNNRGQRVNSIFGEGVSPRLRKVREGLDQLDFPSEMLLRHGRHRIVYGIPLVRNLKEYLLGMETTPDYLVEVDDAEATAKVAVWWKRRWLLPRIQSNKVLKDVRQHTLALPIRHGARVPSLQEEGAQSELSFDWV